MKMKKVAVTLNLLPRQALDILEEVDVTREEERLLQQVILESWDADTITRLICDFSTRRELSRIQILQGASRVGISGDSDMAIKLLRMIPNQVRVFQHVRTELLKKVLRRPIRWWIDELTADWSVLLDSLGHVRPEEWEMVVRVVLRSRSQEFAEKLFEALVPWINNIPITAALRKLARE